ncbi:MAG: hypothetical protein E7411_03985 [Ruminococcaceae bacterium]|nr:hypothetical protein [Oscillospiraceae bacterium]
MTFINENILCIFILPVFTGIMIGISFWFFKKTYIISLSMIFISALSWLIVSNINTHGSEGGGLLSAMLGCITTGIVFIELIKLIVRLLLFKKEKNMNFRKSRNLMWIGLAVAIVVMILGTGFENEKVTGWFMFFGTLIFIAALLQAFALYICPHCGYSLMNVRGSVPAHCPKCGNELKE